MLLLALALLGAKLDDPAPIAGKLDDPPAFVRQVVTVALREEAKPAPPPKPPTPKPSESTPKVPPAAKPVLWQLKDRSGRTWTHTDPRWLQTYVGQVNASLVPQYTAPVYQFGSPCANGSCQR